MDGYEFCIKHILEDPSAPFVQCEQISTKTNRRCTNPVSVNDPTKCCGPHKLMLGLIQKKQRKSKNSSKSPTPQEKEPKKETKKEPTRKYVQFSSTEQFDTIDNPRQQFRAEHPTTSLFCDSTELHKQHNSVIESYHK